MLNIYFLQVFVEEGRVSDAQNCGNLLAGVAPFAIERALVTAQIGETPVRIFMQNTSQVAIARVKTPNKRVTYSGDARIDGVPGTSAAIAVTFEDTEGSSCGAVFPTGQPIDTIDGIELTMIDNGMPCVLMRAIDLGLTGTEAPSTLDDERNPYGRASKPFAASPAPAWRSAMWPAKRSQR